MKDFENDVDIEALAKQTNKDDLKDMVTDILNQNTNRIPGGKKRSNTGTSQTSKPKMKRTVAAQQKRMREKNEKLLRILKNDDD